MRAFGFQFPVISCGATYAVKKVFGYAEVAEDGSAHFRVPANVPIYFEALDAHGRAVQRMRSFTHFQPGEGQGCIGCHEPRHEAPALHFGDALRRTPQELVERRLRQNSDRLRKLREELRVIDEQLEHLADDADDKGIRALVAETPFAASEYREAQLHADAMARHRAHIVASIEDLERRQDDLLDRLGSS